MEEIKTEGSRYKNNYVVDSIFIGGGTPSILKAEDISRILNALKETYEIDNSAEISIECNPGTVVPGFFDKIKAAGVNRVSIGLQSAMDEELKLGKSIDKIVFPVAGPQFGDTDNILKGPKATTLVSLQ